jgi:metallophosphoesterase (TIGR00282 family)
MNILYIGDIMGEVGVAVVEEVLPDLIKKESIDFVIAQAENVTDGRGLSVRDLRRLQKANVDFFSGGNWTPYLDEIWPLLKDDNEPVIAPANYLEIDYGKGYKYITKNDKTILVISLLGHIVGKDSDKKLANPLQKIDSILNEQVDTHKDAVIVNLHGDYSSEKVIIGHYLDGRVSLVVGDHWHVPTADARILPKGTAHITDVGMCGALNASLGITLDSVIPRWRDGIQTRNILESEGSRQFNAVLASISGQNKADNIKQIQMKL